jgi:GalNAc-alpha-(1->4)-GalNAc-alpha-(1->3)-diNAcBac-PP-undecaprenol alpha-1,4-N-acetyl-D-galactosaminyltransferase
MKILLVIPSLRRGGAERVASTLSRAWSRDHEVIVAVFNGAEPAYPHGGTRVDLGLPAARGSFRPLRGAARMARRVLCLRALLAAQSPDRVIGFMETAALPLVLAAALSGNLGKLTVSVRGNPDRMELFQRLLARLFYPRAARIAFPSRQAAARGAALLALPASKVRVLRSPLDARSPEADARAENAPEGPYFFAAGRLVPGKDFERLLRLFARAETGGARLFIAGGGPERPRLEAVIAELGLAGRARLLGELADPFPFMRGALALLMTSRHESFPMTLIEAFACGCPAIVFDCDFGPREAVRDGDNGYLIPLEEDRLFIERMEQLASDPALRARLGAAARERAADFEPESAAAAWLEP